MNRLFIKLKTKQISSIPLSSFDTLFFFIKMETLKPKLAPNNNKSKLAKTFQKVINLRNSIKISSNSGIGICMLTSHNKFDDDDTASFKSKTHHHYSDKHGGGDPRTKHRAVMEALVAKLAGITFIKASYAELHIAQNPYNNDSIHVADQAVVDELKARPGVGHR
ncbi:hypothetical protein Dsin_015180 [Dipteronia sinensis]|uniref:DUF641 domain-containing protein n=1 Tax=Dipteronia sinensis TaxID=43782 RepID=A0AAE0AAT7_9ROSI|nr:hypothetical protein Dsin_015180 [Dipteronia sinensis]